MKYRQAILTQMEILSSLFSSPKVKTRLAQACNINQGRIDDYTRPLLLKGLIKMEISEGKELYSITEEGYKVYRDWLEIWRRLPLS